MTSLTTSLPVAEWLEPLAGVQEVMGLTPIGDSQCKFFVPCSRQLNIPSLLRMMNVHLVKSYTYKKMSIFTVQLYSHPFLYFQTKEMI